MRAIRHTEKNLKMPPGKPLAPEVVADFELWIREGAAMPADQPAAAPKQKILWSLTSASVAGVAPGTASGLGP